MEQEQEIEGIKLQKDEALVVYYAGPNKFGQFSLRSFHWEHDEEKHADVIASRFLLTAQDIESDFKSRGLKVRRIDERAGAMR